MSDIVESFDNAGDYSIQEALKTEQHKESAVIHALRCGQGLIKLKKELPHGEFIPWIEANMPIGKYQCQTYMRVSEYVLKTGRDPLLDGKSIRQLEDMRMADERKIASEKKKKEQKAKPKNPVFDEPVAGAAKRAEAEPIKPIPSRNLEPVEVEMTYNDALEIFGIGITKKEFAIKAIYNHLSRINHPDKGGSDEEMANINKAREILS